MGSAKIDKLGKIGFVFSGGSMRGAFQAGALEVVWKQGIHPHYVFGVSVGALNASAAALGKANELIDVWENIDRKDVYRFPVLKKMQRGILFSASLFENDPLIDLMLKFSKKDPKKFRTLQEKEEAIGRALTQGGVTPFGVVATNWQLGQPEVFTNYDQRVLDEPALLAKAIRASGSIPLFFPLVDIGEYQYGDGNAKYFNTLRPAVEAGCDTIIFFHITHSSRPINRYAKMIDVALRVVEMNVALYKEDKDLLNEALSLRESPSGNFQILLNKIKKIRGKDVRLVTIKPSVALPDVGFKATGNFDKNDIRLLIEEGRKAANETLGRENLLII